jgi:hypothetical protein
LFRNAALTIMADPNGGSFVDIPKLFRDPAFVEQKLKYVTDQNVIEFWRKEMPQSQRSNEFGEVVSWFISKFGAFLSNEMMRNIIGQSKSSFDLREVMDNNKILLVNLSKGRTGDLNSRLLGMIFVMKFQAAAMSRADIPEEFRQDFCLYVDEFQNFSTDSFADILSEARKYRLNVIVANQFTTQLSEEVRDAVFGNVGTVVTFRVGTNDAEFLAKQFAPIFDIDDMQFLPNYNTAVRMLIGGVPVQPFSMATLPQLGQPNKQLADALKQLSAAKYGRAKAVVEAEIFKRMETQPRLGAGAPKPGGSPFDSLGLPPAGRQGLPPASSGASSKPDAPSSGSSFLDEWLAKRKGGAPAQAGTAPTYPLKSSAAPADIVSPTTSQAAVPAPQRDESTLPPKANMGELKIKRDGDSSYDNEASGPSGDGEAIHIDKDGNLSFGA